MPSFAPGSAASACSQAYPSSGVVLAMAMSVGHITQAQYLAAQEFRKHYAAADSDPSAGKWLAKCYRELGIDGSALVHDMLIDGKTTRQIAEARGKTGPDWSRYFARRFFEALNTLAEEMGFANADRG